MRLPERVARLEEPRGALEAVLAWVERAHEWGSAEAYEFAVLDPRSDGERFEATLQRLVAGVHRSARDRARMERADLVRAAYRDAVFLHCLVEVLDSTIVKSATDLGLAGERFLGGLDRLFPEPDAGRRDGRIRQDRALVWLDRAAATVRAYQTIDAAVATLQLRYLAGREVTFPDTRRSWQLAGDLLDDLRALAGALVEHHMDAAEAPAWQATDDGVAAWVRLLDRGARVDALVRLGDVERARSLIALIVAESGASPVAAHGGEDLRSEAT